MRFSSFVKRSIVASCAYYVLSDWLAGRRLLRGNIATRSGTRHMHGELSRSLEYVDRVFNDYKAYAGIDSFYGRVCEIGPGDNFGVALRFLGEGVSELVAIDRFIPERDIQYQRQIYHALAERYGLWNLFDGSPDESTVRALKYQPGSPAEEYFDKNEQPFDFIVSRAVLEHLSDPIRSLDQMYDRLAPGGYMIHRIDLRDHGLFPYHHPLTFLTIPDVVYRKMVLNTGKPNRVLSQAYRSWLSSAGCDGSVRVTRIVGEPTELGPADWEELPYEKRASALESVGRIRNRLAKEFRAVADQDLATSGVVLVARKPINASR